MKLVGKKLLVKGFTLVELLIVIVVIGIIAGIVLNVYSGVQDSARIAKAESELKIVDGAIKALAVDTGKWPNGCPIGIQSNPETAVELAEAGLEAVPPVGVVDVGCEWTIVDQNNWNGPYLNAEDILDAWDNSYIFDPDYSPFENCATEATLPVISVVVSHGEDGNQYSCDDIYREIKN